MKTEQTPPTAQEWRERGPEEWAALEQRVKEAETHAAAEERESVLQWRETQALRIKLQEIEAARIKEALAILSTFADRHAELIAESQHKENIIMQQEEIIRRLNLQH